LVSANGDGATGGFGIGKNHSIYLRKLGVDVITSGDQIFYKKDMVGHIETASYILRPANLPAAAPGRGWRYYNTEKGRIAVISLLGQSGYERIHPRNSFGYLPELVSRIKGETRTIIVDFHALATAEKYSFFYNADGLVTAAIGTGTRVQTADEQVLPKGTAVICDAGRTGSQDSVGGLDPEIEIRKYLTGIPERSRDAWGDLELQGVLLDIQEDGRCTKIERFRRKCKDAGNGGEGNDNQDKRKNGND
jgi:hypothetical protein